MTLDLLEGVRALQWSVSTHRTHPASRTPSISQPKWADTSYWLSGRTLVGCRPLAPVGETSPGRGGCGDSTCARSASMEPRMIVASRCPR